MSALLAQQWFTPAQLAAEIESRTGAALQIDTLSKWRSRGIGPAFIKLSRTAVAYAHEDVEAWLQERRKNGSTAKKPEGITRPRGPVALQVPIPGPGIQRHHKFGGHRTQREGRIENPGGGAA